MLSAARSANAQAVACRFAVLMVAVSLEFADKKEDVPLAIGNTNARVLAGCSGEPVGTYSLSKNATEYKSCLTCNRFLNDNL